MTQIILFFYLHYIIVITANQTFAYLPFLKIGMIILSFIKLVHFVMAFTGIGFFIQMLTISLKDLFPFLISYISFGCFFTTLYSAIEAENDE